MTAIAILGEYTPAFAPHAATTAAIAHARARLGVAVDAEWTSTAAVDETLFERFDALWIAPGSPYKDLEQTLWAIREARERGVPCLGTCGGFQHMVLEYARHVLGFRDAQHAEYDPYASRLFVTQLACSLAGRAMRLAFAPDSEVAAIYGARRDRSVLLRLRRQPGVRSAARHRAAAHHRRRRRGRGARHRAARPSLLHRHALCPPGPVDAGAAASAGDGVRRGRGVDPKVRGA